MPLNSLSPRILCLILAGLFLVTSCSPQSLATVPSVPTLVDTPTSSLLASQTPTLHSTIEPSATPQPTPETTSGYQLRYQFALSIDYEAKKVEVDQSTSLSGLPNGIVTIVMVVEPNRYPGGFSLGSLQVNDIPVETYSLISNQLKLDIPEAARTQKVITIHLLYSLQLPAIPPPSELYKPQPFGFTERQLNLVDWFPFIPPLDEQNQWVVHPPHVFGETLVYPLADFEVELVLNGNHAPLIVAASSNGSRSENRYSYEQLQARNFVLSVSPDYQVLETEAAGIDIKAYAFSESNFANQAVIEYAAQALTEYSDLYGPLPRQSVSIVQADFLDGMEFDGLYFVSKGFYNLFDGTVNGYLSLITVHEMAHQWWYGVVANDQALYPWLDEGLSTFAELQYIEKYYPDQVNWWWAYRVNYYQPEGWIDLSVYDYQFYTGYRNAVYLRSAQFLADLRDLVGIDAYNASIKRYVQSAAGQVAGPEDFWKAFADQPGYPFSDLRREYFQNSP